MSSLVMSVRSSVFPSSVEISLERCFAVLAIAVWSYLLYLKETMAVTRVKTVVILTLSFALNHYRINPVHAKTVISIMLQAQLDQIGQKRPKRFLMTQLITRFLKTASILQLTRIYIYISNLYNLYKLLK